MGFEGLPLDLKNIISDFAYECKWETVEENLVMCETVKQMHISSVFTREIMWSSKYREYIPCPFRCFEPIQNYSGTWADYIDWCAVTELLWRLDFRRRYVRLMFTRAEWRALFKGDWRNISGFDDFYRFLLYTRVPCFKPLWKPLSFNGLKSFRSPYNPKWWWLSI